MFQIVGLNYETLGLDGTVEVEAIKAIKQFIELGRSSKHKDVSFRETDSLVVTAYKPELSFAVIYKMSCSNREFVEFLCLDFEDALSYTRKYYAENTKLNKEFYTSVKLIDLDSCSIIVEMNQKEVGE